MQQHQHQGQDSWKRNYNIAYAVFLWHQRALVVTSRKNFGVQAIGMPCLLAFALMILWWMAVQDMLMLLWIGFWLLCQIKCRIQAVRLSSQVHSWYDGFPINLGSNEKLAKLLFEPVLFGGLGAFLFWVYEQNGWRPTGLPYFFLAGIVSLPFIELTNRTIWKRRLQAMSDARMEQELLMRDYHNRFGH